MPITDPFRIASSTPTPNTDIYGSDGALTTQSALDNGSTTTGSTIPLPNQIVTTGLKNILKVEVEGDRTQLVAGDTIILWPATGANYAGSTLYLLAYNGQSTVTSTGQITTTTVPTPGVAFPLTLTTAIINELATITINSVPGFAFRLALTNPSLTSTHYTRYYEVDVNLTQGGAIQLVSATLNGVGLVQGTASAYKMVAATALNGVGLMPNTTGAGAIRQASTTTLPGVGLVPNTTGAGAIRSVATATLPGEGLMGLFPGNRQYTILTMPGEGTLGGTVPGRVRGTNLTMDGAGLVSVPFINLVGGVSVSLDGVGTLEGSPTTVGGVIILGSVTMSGVGLLNAFSGSVQDTSLTMPGEGLVNATPHSIEASSLITMSGVGLMSLDAGVIRAMGTTSLVCTGEIDLEAGTVHYGEALLEGIGSVTTFEGAIRPAILELAGVGTLTGTATISGITIDNLTSYVLNIPMQSISLTTNGSNWWVL